MRARISRRHGERARHQRRQRPREGGGILVAHHGKNHRRLFAAETAPPGFEKPGRRSRIVRAVEHEPPVLPHLESPRPAHRRQGWRNGRFPQRQARRPHGRQRQRGIVPLMLSFESKRTVPGGVDKFDGGSMGGRGDPENLLHQGILGRGDHGGARLDDAGLFRGHLAERVAEIILMIHRHRREHRHDRLHDIGRIEPPTQARLPHDDLRALRAKVLERERGGEFKKGRRIVPLARELAQPLDALTHVGLWNRRSIHADALAKRNEMRRSVQTGAKAGGPAKRIEHRADRSLAVGAGNVQKERREAARRVVEVQLGQQPPHVVEAQLDARELRRVEPAQGIREAVDRRPSTVDSCLHFAVRPAIM